MSWEEFAEGSPEAIERRKAVALESIARGIRILTELVLDSVEIEEHGEEEAN